MAVLLLYGMMVARGCSSLRCDLALLCFDSFKILTFRVFNLKLVISNATFEIKIFVCIVYVCSTYCVRFNF